MYCKNCGEEFKSANTIFCTNCNTRVGDGNKFCSECGEPIGSSIQSNCSKCGVMLNLTKKDGKADYELNNETFQSNINSTKNNDETFQSNTNPTGYTNQTYNQTFTQNDSREYNDNTYSRDNYERYKDEFIGKPRSKVIAILFALFLGPFGAHRYYIGRPVSASVMLVISFIGASTIQSLITCVYIWAIVDIFLIGFNKLKPKNGYF